MACNITKGRKLKCNDGFSGLAKIYFANSLSAVTYAEDGYTISGLTADETVYEYELKGASTFTEVMSVSDNKSTTCVQTLTISLNGLDASLANEIKLMCYGNVKAFVVDNLGVTRLAFAEFGGMVTSATGEIGANAPDKYGYTLVITGTERSYSPFVSGSTLSSPFGGIDNPPTIVDGNTEIVQS